MSDNRISRILQGFAVVMLGLMGSAAHAADEEEGCGVGEVCDTRGNGRGIYVAHDGKYCLRYSPHQVFCPEAFERSPTTPLVLRGRLLRSGTESVVRLPVTGYVPTTPSGKNLTQVDVVRVGMLPGGADPSKLSIAYRIKGSTQLTILQGANLPYLTLRIGGTSVSFDLKFTEVGVPDGNSKLHRYRATYISGTKRFKGQLCANPAPTQPPHEDKNALSFLPGKSVNGVTGTLEDASDTSTMACGTGAIVTCMNWGYMPWNPKLATAPVTELLGACIQAKRAAFYVSKGDHNAYTTEGTPFQLHDKWLSPSSPDRIEAFWSPTGATCFNLDNWRGKGSNPNQPPDGMLPKCQPSQVGQSVFATGVAPAP